MRKIRAAVGDAVGNMPLADVHTHLGAQEGRRQARTLADLVSYHWLHLELVRAGADVPQELAGKDPSAYLRGMAPFFSRIRNTSNHFCFSGMLRDLYGLDGRTLTPENWQDLDQRVREKGGDPGWVAQVLDRAKVRKLMIATCDRRPEDPERFVPYAYGEYLFAPTTKGRLKQLGAGDPPSVPDAEALGSLIRAEIARLANGQGVRALHVWIRDTWQYTDYTDEDVSDLVRQVAAGATLDAKDEDRLISFCADTAADAAGEHGMPVQLFHGMWHYHRQGPSGQGVSSFWHAGFLRCLPVLAARHPRTLFDVFLGTRIPSHEMASLARTANNLTVSGGWWHGFTPSTLKTFFRDRLELLPHTVWNAFFSDGYIVEWIYAKSLLTRNCLSRALAEMVDEGYLTIEDALDMAARLLYENATTLYGM